MKILVLNCGSSSVKYKLIALSGNEQNILAEGGVEKIGLPDSFLKFKYNGEKVTINASMPNHNVAIRIILDNLTSEKFNSSVLINDEVIAKVKECYDLAPLHNPVNIAGVDAISEILPDVPQVGVFDTAFHQTMPSYAYMYGLPYEMYEKYGVRRYGFHGTSHRYVSRRACEFLGLEYEKQRIITCHIGNGGSITAIKDGKSVDTSMGMTPVEGLIMGTRCGDVDPGALLYIQQKEHLDHEGMQALINKKSGVAGLTGVSSDMRDIEKAVEEGNERAIMALNMYEYRITKYIGAYTAALGGVDVIVFTGGVGENQTGTRERICKQLAFLGIEFDVEKNKTRGEEIELSTPNSKVRVVVIPTDEEYMIARDTEAIVKAL